MHFSKYLLLAAASLALSVSAIGEVNTTDTNTNTNTDTKAPITPEAQCVIDKNCNADVSCIARCYNVPAPTDDMVYQTNECAVKCPNPSQDYDGYLKCYNDCVDNFYMGNNINGNANPAPNTNPNPNTNTDNTNNNNNNNNSNGNNGNNGNTGNSNGTNQGNNTTTTNGSQVNVSDENSSSITIKGITMTSLALWIGSLLF